MLGQAGACPTLSGMDDVAMASLEKYMLRHLVNCDGFPSTRNSLAAGKSWVVLEGFGAFSGVGSIPLFFNAVW